MNEITLPVILFPAVELQLYVELPVNTEKDLVSTFSKEKGFFSLLGKGTEEETIQTPLQVLFSFIYNPKIKGNSCCLKGI